MADNDGEKRHEGLESLARLGEATKRIGEQWSELTRSLPDLGPSMERVGQLVGELPEVPPPVNYELEALVAIRDALERIDAGGEATLRASKQTLWVAVGGVVVSFASIVTAFLLAR